MNTGRNAGRRRGEVATGGNQVPPQALTAEIEMHINPVLLTDGEVRKSLVQMAKHITLQAYAMTIHAE